jgi:hypothetical protein
VTTLTSLSLKKGVRVEVRGAEREPAVVDDPDLRVHVHAVAGVARARSDRRGEEAPLLAVGFSEEGELPAAVVLSGVGLARQHDDDPKLVGRRAPELVGKDVHDLRRPQELVLQVDQLLR